MPVVLAIALAAVAVASAADSERGTPGRFLRAQPPSELGAEMQQALSEALGVGFRVDGGRMLEAQASLEPVWRTMAKDAHGRIDHRSLRYMVQRHFQQKHHISIIGMEALQVNSSSSAAEARLLAELTPNFVRSLLEGASAEDGFSLEDTAALVAVVEHLVEDSGHESLEESYKAAGYDITNLLTRSQLVEVMQYYLLRWFYGSDYEYIAKVEANRTIFDRTIRKFRGYVSLITSHVLALEHQRSNAVKSVAAYGSGLKEAWHPFRPFFSFADAQVVTSGFSTQFGSYWETECEDLMQVLNKNAKPGTGRVALSTFHKRSLEGQWHFSESKAYLRQLGVLDESSFFHGPQVIAANYIQSSNSCVVGQKHFRVCCANPCQDFYSDLEAAIGGPEGVPEEVLAIVSNFSHGLDDEPPRITAKLKAQIQEIAQANHGMVPLHGRLFAQWLHFVFPTECTFPHKANSVGGLSPAELQDDEFMATVAEMRENAKQANDNTSVAGNSSDELMGMWSYDEELLSQRLREKPPSPRSSLRSMVRAVLYGFATISVFVIGVLQPAMRALGIASECGLLPGKKLSGGLPMTIGGSGSKTHVV